ncbi:MAG: hypothetical protein ABSG53_30705, partial [Thermoguttaceae bacterium]
MSSIIAHRCTACHRGRGGRRPHPAAAAGSLLGWIATGVPATAIDPQSHIRRQRLLALHAAGGPQRLVPGSFHRFAAVRVAAEDEDLAFRVRPCRVQQNAAHLGSQECVRDRMLIRFL